MTSPTDAAWDVLQEGHRVEKILPLIPLAMAGYGAYQGAKNVKDNRVTDPILGTKTLAEGDDKYNNIATQFGSGFAQGSGGGVGATAKLGGRFGAKLFGRKAAKQAAEKAAAQNAARYTAERTAGKAITNMPTNMAGSNVTNVMTPAQNRALQYGAQQSPYALNMGTQAAREAGRAGALGRAGTQAGLRGSQAVGNNARNIGGAYALQNAGLDPVLALLAMGGSLLQNKNPTDPPEMPEMTGMSPGYAGAGASGTGGYQLGQAGGGIGGVQNVGVGQTNRQAIWQNQQDSFDQAYEPQRLAPEFPVQWQDPNSQASSQKLTGEYMDLGNFLLKSAIDDMERKASCPTCGKMQKMCGCEKKAECPKCGKNCKCDTKKADGKKKPAHGMVIVIGSGKSGPGASTEGKRDKKKE